MADPGRWLTIVGIGEDGRDGLSPAAAAVLDAADIVWGGRRHLALAAPLKAETRLWPSPISDAYPAILERRGRPTCLLATGDPFHYGIGAEIARLVPPAEIRAFPQPSAFSLAAARLGWPLAETDCLTLHGRALARLIPHLQPGARLLALSWDGTTPQAVAKLLTERGFARSRLTVLEAMGGPRERIVTGVAEELAGDFDPLNTLAIEVEAGPSAQVLPLACGLDDAHFENDGQLTKAEIRAVTLAALAPRAGGLLWDVGAGAGSVGIEWCLRHPRNRALAIEARPDRGARLLRNAEALGVPDRLTLVEGRAPEILAGLARPDAVFVGGGVGVPGLLDAAREALAKGGRLVANAVTLEGEAALLAAHAGHGGTLRRLAITRADPVGSLTGWRPAMPVTQWVFAKP